MSGCQHATQKPLLGKPRLARFIEAMGALEEEYDESLKDPSIS